MKFEFEGADAEAVDAYRQAVTALVKFQTCDDELEARLEKCNEFAVGQAYAAFLAVIAGETSRAQRRAGLARRSQRFTTRRERQLVEVLLLAVDGEHARAAGLAAEHVKEFAIDEEALVLVGRWFRQRASVDS